MKIKIAVVDDDGISRGRIRALAAAFLDTAGVHFEIREYEQPGELLFEMDQGNSYDLFLLDVKMDGISGIELGKEIRKRYQETFIIYISGYISYAVDAIEVNTFRFIPKSSLDKKLPEALEQLLPKLEEQKREYYLVKYYLDTEVLQVRDIYAMKKEDKYVVLYHKGGESRVRKSLKEVLNEIHSDEFVETKRGCAVNVRHVVALRSHEILLRNGMTVSVGRCNLNEVKRKLENLL